MSIYLGSDGDMEGKLKKAEAFGLKVLFTSLHIPEEDHSTYQTRLKELGRLARKFELALVADISPQSISYLGIENYEELIEWGLTGIRPDYGYTDDLIVSLSQKMKVGLNASTVTKVEIERWIEMGANSRNLEAWHNYYPRPETGLDDAFFAERNAMFRKYGIQTMAFIAGDEQFRGPIYAGLPTLEKHRGMPPHGACAELIYRYKVDHVLVGDISISDDQLSKLSLLAQGVIPLDVENPDQQFERFHVAGRHENRPDPARDVIRSMASRRFHDRPDPLPSVERKSGVVTIDNANYGRYAGEIQLTKRSLPADDRVNVIGNVTENDLPLLQWIGASQPFHLQLKNDAIYERN
ncbi:DUF871 domain-containing protein [Pseudalkalibacillus hwajinpoensis]|uniref:DUF871 domain-containing protein n=1 Tax=Guptibacillus hwajinpoensis TaxID=208199 RepID=UPI001CFF11D6|nr:MupG family TIM beta-alpha barrel fold protein [Pseudalkalibacillus hwajinpoensis]